MLSELGNLKFRNVFRGWQYRNGVLIRCFETPNAIVTVGMNDLLDCMFGGGTQRNPWYFGLINNTPTPTLLAADTLASHSGWAEWTGYSGNRKEWVDAAASGGVKTTSSLASFTMNAAGSLYGAFLASVDTGTSGMLWAHAALPEVHPVAIGDIIKVTYTVSVITS